MSTTKKSDRPPEEGNITPGHVRAFQMITSPLWRDSITLQSCTINDEPGVAVLHFEHAGEDKVMVMPLFVAITPSMKIKFLNEASGRGGDDGEGGPNRYDVLKEYGIFEPGGAS